MIHWSWLFLALFTGFIFGVIAVAVLAAGRDEHHYRLGYMEGHTEGYQAGLAELQKVG